MIRFLLCPGRVTSRNDGQVHYVSSQDLAKLYGVNPAECDVSRQTMSAVEHGLIELHPRSDGDYSLDGDLWYSDRALAKQAALDISPDPTRWTDLMGLLQPRTEAPPWLRCAECSGDARDRAGGRMVGRKLLCELHAGRAEWPEPTVANIQEMLDRANSLHEEAGPCCCHWGGAVGNRGLGPSGETPEFPCDFCPKHGGEAQGEFCRRHRRSLEPEGGLSPHPILDSLHEEGP